jgi:hypothetical protein
VASVTQQIIVVLLVAIATVFSAWKLMPARRRLQLMLSFDAWLARRDFLQGWRERVLGRHIRAAAGPGCAGCAANTGIGPHHPPR